MKLLDFKYSLEYERQVINCPIIKGSNKSVSYTSIKENHSIDFIIANIKGSHDDKFYVIFFDDEVVLQGKHTLISQGHIDDKYYELMRSAINILLKKVFRNNNYSDEDKNIINKLLFKFSNRIMDLHLDNRLMSSFCKIDKII